eukprot:s1265_g30.t1
MVPADPLPLSLQQMMHPILIADRQIQDLYQCLSILTDIEDYLEDHDVPAALLSVRHTLRFLRRSIADLSIHRLQLFLVFQRSLRQHLARFQFVPGLDLEL